MTAIAAALMDIDSPTIALPPKAGDEGQALAVAVTGFETSDTQGVLDGDLDGFMASTLAQDVAGKSRAEALAEE